MNTAALRSNVAVLLFSAVGMMLGYWLAPRTKMATPTALATTTTTANAVSTRSLELLDAKGHRRALLTTLAGGSPAIWFFDANGKARLNLGLYEDNNAFVVLNDEHDQAVNILRTVGDDTAPVLVMKSHGQDRIIMGLNFRSKRDPFFVRFDADGTKNTVFGNY